MHDLLHYPLKTLIFQEVYLSDLPRNIKIIRLTVILCNESAGQKYLNIQYEFSVIF